MGRDIDAMHEAAAALGRLGGKAGTGKAKVRGDSEYYRSLRASQRSEAERILADILKWWDALPTMWKAPAHDELLGAIRRARALRDQE